jgi:hypothetical protein
VLVGTGEEHVAPGVEQLHWFFYGNDDGERSLLESACLRVTEVFVSAPTNGSLVQSNNNKHEGFG